MQAIRRIPWLRLACSSSSSHARHIFGSQRAHFVVIHSARAMHLRFMLVQLVHLSAATPTTLVSYKAAPTAIKDPPVDLLRFGLPRSLVRSVQFQKPLILKLKIMPWHTHRFIHRSIYPRTQCHIAHVAFA